MATPLYNTLKKKGTTLYTFPSSAEDIHDNYEFDFVNAKVALLNLPRKVDERIFEFLNVDPTVSAFFSDPAYLNNFPNSDSSFGAQLVNSLRNYVANQEVVIRESRTGESSYYYNPNILNTNTEKIFWKWLRKLNVIKFEKANDETYAVVSKRDYNKGTDINSLRWKERVPEAINILAGGFNLVGNDLEITLNGSSNLIISDYVTIGGTYSGLLTSELQFLGYTDTNPLTTTEVTHKVTNVTTDLSNNTVITIDVSSFIGIFNTSNLTYDNNSGVLTGVVILDYNQVVQYMGEVSSINKVKQSNQSYSEVYAHIPVSCGKTPTILFKTDFNENYEPNLTFPILAEDDLPDGVISGAEFANNKLNTNPTDYVGNKYGQFDNDDYKYTTENGNVITGRGDYFGVNEIDGSVIDIPTKLDGLQIDWDKNSYYKITPDILTFEQFSSLVENGIAPQEFEFNCVLWYYDLVDKSTGDVKATNLYGIQFMDNPDNDIEKPTERTKINTLRKFVSNGNVDGNSYTLKLNRKYDITSDNIIPTFDPETANRPVDFAMFADAMTRLATIITSFQDIVLRNESIALEVENLKTLFYNQDSLDKINARIDTLDSLLNKLKTLQIASSEDIEAVLDTTKNPPLLYLVSLTPNYKEINNVNVTELYSDVYSTITPKYIPVAKGRNQLINIINNDVNNISIEGGSNLRIILDKELVYKQKIELMIYPNNGYENKKLDIYIPLFNSTTNTTVDTPLIENIDLPLDIRNLGEDINDFNAYYSNVKRWKNDYKLEVSQFEIDVTSYSPLNVLKITHTSDFKYKAGDILTLEDFKILDNPNVNEYDFSGQYRILDVVGDELYIDINAMNDEFNDFLSEQSYLSNYDLTANGKIVNPIVLKTVKKVNIEIIRVSNDNSTDINSRYTINKKYIYE